MMQRIDKTITLTVLLFLMTLFYPSHVLGEILIISNKSLNIDSITAKQAKKLWLGKAKKVGSSGKVIPVDAEPSSSTFSLFYKKIANKSPSQIKLYWSKEMFSGKNFPAKRLSDDKTIIQWVIDNPNALGYIDSANVNDSIKVLGTFK